MIDGPLGGAAFNNEFGRPNLCGCFRTLEIQAPGVAGDERRGYHKPIMIAGGLGNVRDGDVHKKPIPPGAKIIVIGGPAMLIGLGGGAASSMASGESDEALDFASVQRDNPEIERRVQEVIDRCWALGEAQPDCLHPRRGRRRPVQRAAGTGPRPRPGRQAVAARHPQRRAGHEPGGNLVQRSPGALRAGGAAGGPGALRGAVRARARAVRGARRGHRSRNTWKWPTTTSATRRWTCPWISLFGKPPKMQRGYDREDFERQPFTTEGIEAQGRHRAGHAPAHGGLQNFLITIGDRSVTGLVHRDQMVGPWQVPVADCAVTATGYNQRTGEAMAMGERTPVALVNAAASGRMAVAETLTNLAGAHIGSLGQIRLSANWMAAAGHPGEDQALFETVKAVGMELCPKLGIAIPVGKDSLSMRTLWQEKALIRAWWRRCR